MENLVDYVKNVEMERLPRVIWVHPMILGKGPHKKEAGSQSPKKRGGRKKNPEKENLKSL